MYRQTKFQNLNISHLILQLSLPDLLKPSLKSRMMQLELRQQGMLQLHQSDQQSHEKINGHRELTAPGPNDHGSVKARLGHSSGTVRSQLSHG